MKFKVSSGPYESKMKKIGVRTLAFLDGRAILSNEEGTIMMDTLNRAKVDSIQTSGITVSGFRAVEKGKCGSKMAAFTIWVCDYVKEDKETANEKL